MARLIALALAGLVAAPAAHAFELNGGEAGLEYSSFLHGGDGDKMSAKTSLELGFSPQFAVQGDLSLSKGGVTKIDGTSLGLHGIYNLGPDVSLGAFLGRDWLDDGDATFYGVEAGGAMNRIRGEGYLSRVKGDGDYGTQFGLRGDYAAMENVSVGARFDTLDLDDADTTRLSLTSGISMETFELTGEIGRAHVEGSDSETFVGVGAKMTFGAKRGATFNPRGLLEVLPGF